MKCDEIIKVPKAQFVKEMKAYNKNPYYSFLFNKSAKNKETGEWETTERYVINVMNIVVKPETEIQITRIIESKPQVMTDKKGKQYLNCLLWVDANSIKKEEQEVNNNNFSSGYSNNNSSNNNMYISEEELPF